MNAPGLLRQSIFLRDSGNCSRRSLPGYFLTGLRELFTPIFAGMMDRGLLCRDNPAMLAFAYTAPISALIHLCDREPDKTEEAMAQIEAFSRHFIEVYGEMDHD